MTVAAILISMAFSLQFNSILVEYLRARPELTQQEPFTSIHVREGSKCPFHCQPFLPGSNIYNLITGWYKGLHSCNLFITVAAILISIAFSLQFISTLVEYL
jgi:hypothetical protein